MIRGSQIYRSKKKGILTDLIVKIEPGLKTLNNIVKFGRKRITGAFGFKFDLSKDEEAALDNFDRKTAKEFILESKKVGIKVRLYLDDPEQMLPAEMHGRDALIGIVLAASEINSNYEGVVCVSVLLKSHIFGDIRKNDEMANIFPGNIAYLSWSQNDLSIALDARLNELGIKFCDVFAMDRNDFEAFVFPKLRNGPRDFFAWLAFAADRSSPNAISKSVLENVIADTGKYSLGQISSAYEKIVDARRLIDVVFDKKKKYKFDELVKRISHLRANHRQFIEIGSKSGFELTQDYIRFLTESGAIIIERGSDKIYPYDPKYAEIEDLEHDSVISLHPILEEALK